MTKSVRRKCAVCKRGYLANKALLKIGYGKTCGRRCGGMLGARKRYARESMKSDKNSRRSFWRSVVLYAYKKGWLPGMVEEVERSFDQGVVEEHKEPKQTKQPTTKRKYERHGKASNQTLDRAEQENQYMPTHEVLSMLQIPSWKLWRAVYAGKINSYRFSDNKRDSYFSRQEIREWAQKSTPAIRNGIDTERGA